MSKIKKEDLYVPLALLLLLLFLLLSGVGTIYFLHWGAESLLEPAERMETLIKEGNWEAAETSYQEIKKEWSRLRITWPMLIHHQEMDRIDDSLSKLKSYLGSQDQKDSLAELYTLMRFIEHIPQKEKFILQNIL